MAMLAAYDPGLESDSGNYWAWVHPDLSRQTLDKLYYDVIAKRRPEDPNELIKEDVVGGCASLDAARCFLYRFFNGDRDGRGRPGRFVVVIAVLPLAELKLHKWTGFLTSPLMQNLAEEALSCPVPVPDRLEAVPDNTATIPSHEFAVWLNGKQDVALDPNQADHALFLLSERPKCHPFHLEIDCHGVKQRIRLHLELPIACLPDDFRPRTSTDWVELPSRVGHERQVSRDTGERTDQNQSKDRIILILVIVVLLLAILLVFNWLDKTHNTGPSNRPTQPSEPVQPLLPVPENPVTSMPDAQVGLDEKILGYVHYYQTLKNQEGPTELEIVEQFSPESMNVAGVLERLVQKRQLKRQSAVYFSQSSQRYKLRLSRQESEQLPPFTLSKK